MKLLNRFIAFMLLFTLSLCSIFPGFSINAKASDTTMTIFSENFDSLASGAVPDTARGWSQEGATNATVTTAAAPASGKMLKIDGTDVLTVQKSTYGFQNIAVSFLVGAVSSSGSVVIEWYDGTKWITLDTISGNPATVTKTYTLGTEANYNNNFKLRFRTSPLVTGAVYVDNILITGDADPASFEAAKLTGLSLDKAALTPAFDPGVTAYTATVSGSVDSIGIIPVISEAYKSNITVNGSSVPSGEKSSMILHDGLNTASIIVTSEDGIVSRTYTVGIIKGIDPTPTPTPPSTPTPNTNTESVTIFSDNFDDAAKYGSNGDAPAAAPWVQEGANGSLAATKLSGTAPSMPNHLKIDSTDAVSLPLNTTAYSNITVSFYTKISSYRSGSIVAEWSADGGATYTTIEDIKLPAGGTSQDYTLRTYSLGAGASDNANFKIRIRVGDTMAANMYIDSFSVKGQLIPGKTPVIIPETEVEATPTPDVYPAPAGVKLYQEVEIGMAGNNKLYTSIAVPEQTPTAPLPVIVYIHGGGGNKGTRLSGLSTICEYVSKGYIGVTIDYRLSTEAIYPAQIQDAKLAIRYLRANADKYYIDPDRIAVWGSSAGSQIATLLGTSADITKDNRITLDTGNTVNLPDLEGTGGWQEYSDRVQAVVDFYGPADFTSEWAGSYSSVTALLGAPALTVPDFARLAMPGTYATPDDPPFFIRHGDADSVVPYAQSVYFYNQLVAAGVKDIDYQIVPGQGHGFIDPVKTEQDNQAWAFLDKYIKNKTVTEHIMYKPGYVSGVTLDKTTATMYAGATLQLNATVNPTGEANKEISWSSIDDKVATVDSNGLVKAIGKGTTTIRARSVSDETYYKDCSITVYIRSSGGGGVIISNPSEKKDTIKVKLDQNLVDSALFKAEADKNGIKTAVIDVATVKGATSYTPVLPPLFFNEKAVYQKLALKTDIGTVTLPGNMFSNTNLNNIKETAITIAAADKSKLSEALKSKIGDRPVFELNIIADGNRVEWNNTEAPVTVAIPYKPSADELKNPENIVVWYLDSAGNAIPVPSGKYDAETGTVVFSTTHFSQYAIGYSYKSFEDIKSVDWAKKEIEVLASKGIINGISENSFSPDANITRADFTMILVKALGLTGDIDASFDDVQKSEYYYEAVSIAKKLGLVQGQGENRFNPDEQISRQDMVAITARALRLQKKLVTTATPADLNGFTDKSDIAAYAADDLSAMVKAGLIKGNSNKIEPYSSTTRAEAAVLMYRIYNLK